MAQTRQAATACRDLVSHRGRRHTIDRSHRHQRTSAMSTRLVRGRTIGMPRKAAPAPTDADDRFDDSRHPHRPVASNGSRSSGARVSSKRHGRRLGRSLLAQSKRGHSRGAGSRTASLPTQAAELREQRLAHACRPQREPASRSSDLMLPDLDAEARSPRRPRWRPLSHSGGPTVWLRPGRELAPCSEAPQTGCASGTA
jgi:hypothetical protein